MPEVVLRRYELMIAYDTAFLYMNTNGAIAERWGHGPYFSAWSELPGQVTLTESQNEQGLVGIIGIRASALVYHSPQSRRAAKDLAVQFLGDCLNTFKPNSIKRITNKQAWIVEAKHPDTLNQVIVNAFPHLDEVVPMDFDKSYSGVSFNAQRDSDNGGTVRSVAHIGMYSKDMAASLFGLTTDNDPDTALGAMVEVTMGYDEGQTSSSVMADLPNLLGSFDSDCDHVVSTTLRRFESNA